MLEIPYVEPFGFSIDRCEKSEELPQSSYSYALYRDGIALLDSQSRWCPTGNTRTWKPYEGLGMPEQCWNSNERWRCSRLGHRLGLATKNGATPWKRIQNPVWRCPAGMRSRRPSTRLSRRLVCSDNQLETAGGHMQGLINALIGHAAVFRADWGLASNRIFPSKRVSTLFLKRDALLATDISLAIVVQWLIVSGNAWSSLALRITGSCEMLDVLAEKKSGLSPISAPFAINFTIHQPAFPK